MSRLAKSLHNSSASLQKTSLLPKLNFVYTCKPGSPDQGELKAHARSEGVYMYTPFLSLVAVSQQTDWLLSHDSAGLYGAL